MLSTVKSLSSRIFSIIFPLLSSVLDPHRGLWLLKSPHMTNGLGIWFMKCKKSS